MIRATILIVDDEPDIRELLSLTIHRMGFDAVTAPDLGSARQLLGSGASISASRT